MIYLDLVRFGFLRFFAFPFELIAQVLKRVVEILFLILFWSLVSRSGQGAIDFRQILAYFFISQGIADLVMARWGAFSSYLADKIKTGHISNNLLKPHSIIFVLYCMAVGRNGLRMILAVINIIIGLIIYPPHTMFSVILFIISFVFAWSISFAYNLIEGTVFFHYADAYGLRNAMQNFMRFLTGGLVPLYLFPNKLKWLISLTPFPSMVYSPSVALSTNSLTHEVLVNTIIALFWTLILNWLALSFWRYSVKKYEAVGI